MKNKYNTIDTSQNIVGAQYNASMPSSIINNNASGMQPQTVSANAPNDGGGHTRGTQDTTNPSNEPNSNTEYLDVARKVPRILAERYELLDVLGKGAHGRIYLATDLVTHERVAIKLVSNHFSCLFFKSFSICLSLNPV